MMRAPPNQRGYTVVELLMSLAVLAVGVSGIIAMQRVTAATNRSARQIATATQIAESWIGHLATDASVWDGQDFTRTAWLKTDTLTGAFFLPVYSEERQFGPAFDVQGAAVETDSSDLFYCTHLRFEPVYAAGSGRSEVVRADVRVFWPRAGAALPEGLAAYCADESDATQYDDATTTFHFVYLTTTLQPGRRTP